MTLGIVPKASYAPQASIRKCRVTEPSSSQTWLRAEKNMLLEDDGEAAEGYQGKSEVREEQEHPPQIDLSMESNPFTVEGIKPIQHHGSSDSTEYQESCTHPRSR